MTPARLMELAFLLLEFEEWLAEDVSDTIEQATCSYLRDVVLAQRTRLMLEGAK